MIHPADKERLGINPSASDLQLLHYVAELQEAVIKLQGQMERAVGLMESQAAEIHFLKQATGQRQ